MVYTVLYACDSGNINCDLWLNIYDKPNPLGDRFVMTVLGCKSSLLVIIIIINQVLRIIKIAVKGDVKTGRI